MGDNDNNGNKADNNSINPVKPMIARVKKAVVVLGLIVAGAAAVLASMDGYVAWAGSQGIYRQVADLPEAQAVLVLGASVYSSGQMGDVFRDRASVALEVYRAGKAKKILVSGYRSPDNYDEVDAAKKFFLENGVPGEDIFLDYVGFDTYDSVYHAKYVFEVETMVIATQGFHLPRALYLARGLGIESFGIASDLRPYSLGIRNFFRENGARVKAFWELAINEQPEIMSKPMPITGSGMVSWD